MKAYFSCGAGDFISIESFLTLEQKKQITSFLLFTRSADTIRELILLHPIWRDCPVQIMMTDSEIKSHNVYSFFDIKHLKRITRREWPELNGAIDFSGEILYPQILSGAIKYTESLFEVEAIPCDLCVDAASNNDDRMIARGRNLTIWELISVGDWNRMNYGRKNYVVPSNAENSLVESLGMVKGCDSFIGVDSMLACYASRQPTIKAIIVKTINPIYRKWLPIYDPFSRIKVVDSFL